MFPHLQVHKWVNVENMMKACFVGPLVTSGSTTTTTTTATTSTSSTSSSTAQNTNNDAATSIRTCRANSLSVPKPIMIVDGKERIQHSVCVKKMYCLFIVNLLFIVYELPRCLQQLCSGNLDPIFSCFSRYLNYKH